MIQTKDLSRVFRTEEIETTALNAINLDVQKGEFLAIMGASGCGKSTLLNLIGLLDTPSGGEFVFNGTQVEGFSEKERTRLRKKEIGFVFQSFNLIDELTVAENVELPLLYQKVPASERKERVKKILDRVNIGHRIGHYPQQLSGGQQQRVAIARALVSEPSLILADEPTGNLDSKNGKEVMSLLSELNEAGTTIVMVTHSDSDAQSAHRVLHMLDGKIISENILKEKVIA